MEIKRRFSPFGIVLFAVLLIGLAFFAFLMTTRGDNPDGDEPSVNADGAPNEEALIPPGQ